MELKIIQSYLDLCFEHGVENITLQKVADKSEVAFGTIRYYFAPTKTINLKNAAVLYVLSIASERVSKYVEGQKNKKNFNPVTSYLDAHFDWDLHHPQETSYLSYFLYLNSIGSKSIIGFDEFSKSGKNRLKSIVFEAVGMKHYELNQGNIGELIESLYSVLIGFLMTYGLSDKPNKKKIRKQCHSIFDLLLV